MYESWEMEISLAQNQTYLKIEKFIYINNIDKITFYNNLFFTSNLTPVPVRNLHARSRAAAANQSLPLPPHKYYRVLVLRTCTTSV